MGHHGSEALNGFGVPVFRVKNCYYHGQEESDERSHLSRARTKGAGGAAPP
jgi:hypothetical protein